MAPDFNLKGKVVAITGAAGVICSEISRALGELGCRLALLNRTLGRAEALAEEIRASGGEAEAYECNVLEKESIIAARDAVVERFGRIDVLINGAGGNKPEATVSPQQSFFDLNENAIRDVFDLNVTGAILCSQIFGKILTQQGSGNILNITSMCGVRPLTNVVGYSAAKAALQNFTQWLASYFPLSGCPNIRVNAISPGFLLTNQNRFLLVDKETGEDMPRGRHIKQQTPMGRYGTPEELIGAVVYLISDAASFVTGVVLPIDGGFSVYSI